MRNYFLVLVCSLLILACDSTHDSSETDFHHDIFGTWLLTERGFSPGSGYIVEPVSPNPAQTITFSAPGNFVSNSQGFEKYKFYTLHTDTSGVSTLRLYESNPESGDPTGPTTTNTFFIEQKDGVLKIMQQGCIEGCHLGFRRNTGSRD